MVWWGMIHLDGFIKERSGKAWPWWQGWNDELWMSFKVLPNPKKHHYMIPELSPEISCTSKKIPLFLRLLKLSLSCWVPAHPHYTLLIPASHDGMPWLGFCPWGPAGSLPGPQTRVWPRPAASSGFAALSCLRGKARENFHSSSQQHNRGRDWEPGPARRESGLLIISASPVCYGAERQSRQGHSREWGGADSGCGGSEASLPRWEASCSKGKLPIMEKEGWRWAKIEK